MKKEKDKWIEAIAKLTEMTQRNNLKWRSGEVPEYFKDSEYVKLEIIYLTKYKDKILRIYEKREKEYFFDTMQEDTKYSWGTQIVLDFADSSGASLWIFPEVQGLRGLLVSVRHQVAKVKDFLEDLLKE